MENARMATRVSQATRYATMNSIQIAREEALDTAIAQARATKRIEGRNPIRMILALIAGLVESTLHKIL